MSLNLRQPRSRAIIFALACLFGVLAVLIWVKPFSSTKQASATTNEQLAQTFDASADYGKAAVDTKPVANIQRDSEEQFASPERRSAKSLKHIRIADMPAASTTKRPAAGAESTKQLRAALKTEQRGAQAGNSGNAVALASDGSALPPIGAPTRIQNLITAANAIKNYPYIWGGGHGSFQDNGYDCSGSVSYALAGAGLLGAPLTSGQLANWGDAGPGKWITIYANAGHVFMFVGGLRYDTSFRDGPRGSRWQTAPRSLKGFEVRHPPGF